MLKVNLTENYGGFNITGSYEDLDFLYDAINYVIKREPDSENDELMQNHLYGFLYEVRHAYQGDRDILFEKEELDDYAKKKNK